MDYSLGSSKINNILHSASGHKGGCQEMEDKTYNLSLFVGTSKQIWLCQRYFANGTTPYKINDSLKSVY